MTEPARRPEERLTPRQLEVLELLSKGLTNAEIAGVLGIAPATAKNHVAAVLETLRASPLRSWLASQPPSLSEGPG